MKAAVMYQKNGLPLYSDIPEPVAKNKNEVLIFMKAAAIKHIDKSRASGKHYSTQDQPDQAQVIGGDGVGVLANGKRVYAIAGNGMMAEKAVVEKERIVSLPPGLDNITAAALPNAVIGSAMALRFRAGLKKGETVLINGATGFTGKMAVQVATYYGAKKIIATGRNETVLQSLKALGANEIISLDQDDESFIDQIRKLHGITPVDVIIDYLWGHSAELILAALKGRDMFTHRTRFISIGSVTGDLIRLSAENLRSADIHLLGSGLGSWTRKEIKEMLREILPKMFRLAAKKRIVVDTVSIDLKDIEKCYGMDVPAGKRLVVLI